MPSRSASSKNWSLSSLPSSRTVLRSISLHVAQLGLQALARGRAQQHVGGPAAAADQDRLAVDRNSRWPSAGQLGAHLRTPKRSSWSIGDRSVHLDVEGQRCRGSGSPMRYGHHRRGLRTISSGNALGREAHASSRSPRRERHRLREAAAPRWLPLHASRSRRLSVAFQTSAVDGEARACRATGRSSFVTTCGLRSATGPLSVSETSPQQAHVLVGGRRVPVHPGDARGRRAPGAKTSTASTLASPGAQRRGDVELVAAEGADHLVARRRCCVPFSQTLAR